MTEIEKLENRVAQLELFMLAVANELKCLPDFYDSLPDKGNKHIMDKLKNVIAQAKTGI